jgi:hypothetical protein
LEILCFFWYDPRVVSIYGFFIVKEKTYAAMDVEDGAIPFLSKLNDFP